MNGDIERRQTLLHDAVDVTVFQIGESDEVSVQEGEPVIVILEIKTAAQTVRELVDEAEDAPVPAYLHRAEDRAVEGKAERLPFGLIHRHLLEAAVGLHVQYDVSIVRKQLVVDHVAGLDAVDGDQAVARPDAEASGRGSRSDFKYADQVASLVGKI